MFNMQVPNWLAALTGARQFANNPANNYNPTLGDAFQGIGHSMMQHYRGQGGQPGKPMAPQINGGPDGLTPAIVAQALGPKGLLPEVNGGPGIAPQGASQNWGSLQPMLGNRPRFDVF